LVWLYFPLLESLYFSDKREDLLRACVGKGLASFRLFNAMERKKVQNIIVDCALDLWSRIGKKAREQHRLKRSGTTAPGWFYLPYDVENYCAFNARSHYKFNRYR
jgi:hypothetical protein